MAKNPLPWLSVPAIITLMAYLGCQPRDIANGLREAEQELMKTAGSQIEKNLQKAFVNPKNNSGYPYPSDQGTSTDVYAPYTGNNFPVSTQGFNQGTGLTPNSGLNSGNPVNQINTGRVPFDNRAIIVGTFNIQKFGRAKLGNPDVMQIIVDMTRRFDLLAIQELCSVEQIIIPKFIEMLNATGMNYTYYVGPRQGYTSHFEQYVYIYDANKLRIIEEPYLAGDPNQMHRTPLVARFQVTELPPDQAFTFCMLNVHTDPDDVRHELSSIKTAVAETINKHRNEDDFIVLGDFNAPTDFIAQFNWFTSQQHVVKDEWVTNVRENRNYDNIVFNSLNTSEFNGQAGVFNFKKDYQLAEGDALQVSDHMPVWAMFSCFESSRSNVATQSRIPR